MSTVRLQQWSLAGLLWFSFSSGICCPEQCWPVSWHAFFFCLLVVLDFWLHSSPLATPVCRQVSPPPYHFYFIRRCWGFRGSCIQGRQEFWDLPHCILPLDNLSFRKILAFEVQVGLIHCLLPCSSKTFKPVSGKDEETLVILHTHQGTYLGQCCVCSMHQDSTFSFLKKIEAMYKPSVEWTDILT